jgi:hypothetical protein
VAKFWQNLCARTYLYLNFLQMIHHFLGMCAQHLKVWFVLGQSVINAVMVILAILPANLPAACHFWHSCKLEKVPLTRWEVMGSNPAKVVLSLFKNHFVTILFCLSLFSSLNGWRPPIAIMLLNIRSSFNPSTLSIYI